MAFLDKLNQGFQNAGGLFGSAQLPTSGLMGEPQPQRDAKLAMAAALLQGTNSGAGFGPNLGRALMAGQQAKQQALQMSQQQQEAQQMQQYRQAQIQHLQSPTENQPASVKEYEFAKANGYQGSYQDWTTVSGQTSRPSSVQEWEFFSALTPEKQKAYLEMKRAMGFKVDTVQGVPTVINQGAAGQPATTQALSNLPAEVAAGGALAQGKAAGTAVGEAQGAQAAKAPAAASFNYAAEQMEGELGKAMQGGIGGITGKAGSILDYKDAQSFDNAREQLSTELRTVFRIAGEGTLSDQEQKQNGLQLPSRNYHPAVNKKIMEDLKSRVRLRQETPIGAKPGAPVPAGAVDIKALLDKYAPATGAQ